MGNQGISGLGDFGLAGDAHYIDLEAVIRGLGLVLLDGGDGVGLAGGIDDANGLGLRLELADQVQLGLNRQLIGGAGDVAGIQLGLDRVGNGGEDHGNVLILSGGVAGHGGGSGDGHHQVNVFSGELLADLGGDVVVKAGVLIIHLQVHALLNAGLGQALKEALPAVIQGGVLAVLGNADGIGFFALLRGGGRLCRLAGAGGDGKAKGQRHQGGSNFLELLHCNISIL